MINKWTKFHSFIRLHSLEGIKERSLTFHAYDPSDSTQLGSCGIDYTNGRTRTMVRAVFTWFRLTFDNPLHFLVRAGGKKEYIVNDLTCGYLIEAARLATQFI